MSGKMMMPRQRLPRTEVRATTARMRRLLVQRAPLDIADMLYEADIVLEQDVDSEDGEPPPDRAITARVYVQLDAGDRLIRRGRDGTPSEAYQWLEAALHEADPRISRIEIRMI